MGGPKGYRARAAAARCRQGALRRRPRRLRGRRDRSAGARRRRADRGRLRAAAGRDRRRGRGEAGAPAVWDECPGNVAVTLAFGNKDATDAAFAKAKHIVSLRLENNRITRQRRSSRAPRSATTTPPTAATRSTPARRTRTACARSSRQRVFNIPETNIRVISPDVGGGFGMKCDAYPEDGLVLWASRRLGRPVKWTSTRSESLLRRHPRPRPGRARRARARRERQDSRHPRHAPARGRRVLVGGDHRAAVLLAEADPERLRHPDASTSARRAVFTNTAPTLGLSRRRPAGGDLSDRAADRRGRARSSASIRVEIRRRNFITPAADALPDADPLRPTTAASSRG